jgi:hypothetical protein
MGLTQALHNFVHGHFGHVSTGQTLSCIVAWQQSTAQKLNCSNDYGSLVSHLYMPVYMQAIMEGATVQCDPVGAWRDATGHLDTVSGVTYDGGVHNGRMHGIAKVQFPDEAHYHGACSNNSLTGPGIMSYDGMRYHGALQDGQHHGMGALKDLQNGAEYEGTAIKK